MTVPDIEAEDAQDMVQLANDHTAGLDRLIERHGTKLFHYLVRSLQNEEEAADLAQETFIRVYQKRAKFNPRQRFSTWLYAIASNLVRDRYRWRLRHPQVSLDAENDKTGSEYLDRFADSGGTPSDGLLQEERAAAVRRAVAELPEELRLPLILAEYEGKSQAEIADILDCSVKAVETRLYRARKQLRSGLASLLAEA